MIELIHRLTSYNNLRAVLFTMPPEEAHRYALKALQLLYHSGMARHLYHRVNAPVRLWDISFPNPVGLAAGMDKDGEYINALASLGFGFIEIGTVTPRPQPGNSGERVWRIPQAQALINRLGFNSKGLDYVESQIRAHHYDGILGINIGKNADTPLNQAVNDYVTGFRHMYPLATYIVINCSSPNTRHLRELQRGEQFNELLSALVDERQKLTAEHGKHVPLVVKIDPDLSLADLDTIAESLLTYGIEGVIATNTTIARPNMIDGMPHSDAQGGLSGAPLLQPSTEIVSQLHNRLGNQVPIIACGGIMSGADATQKIKAGASLVQFYTGFVYHGPDLIKETAQALQKILA